MWVSGYWHYVAFAGILGFTVSISSDWALLLAILTSIMLFRWDSLPKIPLSLCILSFIAPQFIDHYTPPSTNTFPYEEQSWHLQVSSAVDIQQDFIRFEATENETNTKWLVYSFTPSSEQMFQYGASCQFIGIPEKPEPSKNPGVFSYQSYLYSKGIQGIITINENEVFCSEGKLMSHIFQLRNQVLHHINDTYSNKTASWINALVFGDDDSLNKQEIELFQRWNLSHLLAISGLHVGLFIAFISIAGIGSGLISKRNMKILIMVFLPIYGVLAGGAPSVLRATMMAEAIILMTFLNQRWRITDILSLVVICVLWMEPSLLFQLGFQFSFIVTFSLLLSKKIFHHSTSPTFNILRVSLVSQLAIFPIQLDTFYTYNPLSILMNLLYIPLFSLLILPCCLVLVLLSLTPHVVTNLTDILFQKIMEFSLEILFIMDEVAYIEELVTGKLTLWVFVAYYVIFVSMMRFWSSNDNRKTIMCGVLLVFILLFDASSPYFSEKGRVMMLDVGQGDTFIIEWPYREKVMMIDAAGAVQSDEDVFSNVIEPYLLSRGIHQVDVLLLSHNDLDHMGSARQVIERFGVQTLITSPYNRVDSQLIHHVKVKKGDQFKVGPSSFQVLHPEHNEKDTNSNSLVIHTEVGGRSWLFTGDISSEQEEKLNDLRTVDVLKVSHHGSRFSTNNTFLQKVKPKIAWISAGENNSHGHPSPEVLERLRDHGIKVMRTDKQGAVYYDFSGGTGTFYRHAP